MRVVEKKIPNLTINDPEVEARIVDMVVEYDDGVTVPKVAITLAGQSDEEEA